MTGKFTGRHMFGVLLAFFGAVIAVNFTMASYASSTFGGIVVENSYVASEKFNGWLERAAAQDALGWSAVPTRRADGRVALAVAAPSGVVASATARRPLGGVPDRVLSFERVGEAAYLSKEALPDGRWILRLELTDGAESWAREERLP